MVEFAECKHSVLRELGKYKHCFLLVHFSEITQPLQIPFMESLRIGRKAGRNAVKLPTVVVCLVSTTGWAEWLEYSVFYKRNEYLQLQVLAVNCVYSSVLIV